MALNIKQLIEDESNDRSYFAMVPTMLWPDIKLASSDCPSQEMLKAHAEEIGVELDIYDKWLYATIKRVCGEKGGQCFLNTSGLARLAGMSEGKVSGGKRKLQEAGLIAIVSKKRSAKGQAIDHITVLDVWKRNVTLIEARQSLHHMKPSPHEGLGQKPSLYEGKPSPHETEEEPIEEEPTGEEEKISPIGENSPDPVKGGSSETEAASGGGSADGDMGRTQQALIGTVLRSEVQGHTGVSSADGLADHASAGQVTAEPGGALTAEPPSAMPVPAADNSTPDGVIGARSPTEGGGETTPTVTTGGAGDAEGAGQRPDMWDLARETEQAQQREGAWSVPAEAGGADPWADGPVDAFCQHLAGIEPAKLPDKKRRDWARKLCAIAGEWDATPEVMMAAIRAIPESAIAWKMANYTSPFKDSFAEDIGSFLSNGGKIPDTLKQKGASRHGSHQRNRIAPGAVERQVASAEKAKAILGDRYGGP